MKDDRSSATESCHESAPEPELLGSRFCFELCSVLVIRYIESPMRVTRMRSPFAGNWLCPCHICVTKGVVRLHSPTPFLHSSSIPLLDTCYSVGCRIYYYCVRFYVLLQQGQHIRKRIINHLTEIKTNVTRGLW